MALPLRWLFGLLLLLAAQLGHAALPLTTIADNQGESILPLSALRVLEDPTSSLQIRTALAPLNNSGITHYGKTSLGYSAST